VESTDTVHSSSPTACAWPCNRRSIWSQIPLPLHVSNRPHTVVNGGKSSGRSRHGDPVRYRQMIASITSR
jgi:hypothetical protein